MNSIVAIYGTRPELIKLRPALEALPPNRGLSTIKTGQHTDLLETTGQSGHPVDAVQLSTPLDGLPLNEAVGVMVQGLGERLAEIKPSLVLVQGDTSSALAGAIAARFAGCGVGHVEAGLRTFDDASPWPEEINRRLVGQLATIHFAPTERSRENLLREGIAGDRIHVTGNTAVDAVERKLKRLGIRPQETSRQEGLIVMTLHRRESHGLLRQTALRHTIDFLNRHPGFRIKLFSHPNPKVMSDLEMSGVREHPLVDVREPVPHELLLEEMAAASFVISDSGGIQEEAPSLQRTVFIARDKTERPEAVDEGIHFLCGADLAGLEKNFNTWAASTPVPFTNPYGDGGAGARIAAVCEEYLVAHG